MSRERKASAGSGEQVLQALKGIFAGIVSNQGDVLNLSGWFFCASPQVTEHLLYTSILLGPAGVAG